MLSLSIENFSLSQNDFKLNIFIHEAKVYYQQTSLELKKKFFNVISNLTDDYFGDIFFNKINIKNNKDARKYLQKHVLLISNNSCLLPNYTILEYLKTISKLWSNRDLSQIVLSGLNLEDDKDKFIYEISAEKQRMLTLARLLTCPSHLWIIDNDIFIDPLNKMPYLSNENADIINNIIDIRIKQGGAILLL